MRVLDLYAGLKGWSQAFEERGHEVFSIELEPHFPGISLYKDILQVMPSDIPWRPDIILASPPCTKFSVMRIGYNWTKDHQPKNEGARHALSLLHHTVRLIQALDPTYFIIENPRAKMRKMPVMQQFELRTVTYCQYGETRMKPTDLWGGFPPSLVLKPTCRNGDPCHEAAPRGAKDGGGTQSLLQAGLRAEMAKIPYQLSLAVCLATEADLAASRPSIPVQLDLAA
jgi:hypothetical protein